MVASLLNGLWALDDDITFRRALDDDVTFRRALDDHVIFRRGLDDNCAFKIAYDNVITFILDILRKCTYPFLLELDPFSLQNV